jgi:hypothetical protein
MEFLQPKHYRDRKTSQKACRRGCEDQFHMLTVAEGFKKRVIDSLGELR